MCARSLEKGTTAITNIKKVHPTATITLLQMDLTDLATIVSAAKHFLTLETSLHGLVNNAGIMATPFAMTKDGHEAQWQTNYLAHWILTQHLLPLLLRTSQTLPPGSVRIVNVASSGHFNAPKEGINFDDTDLKEGDIWQRYGQGKLAQVLHARTLHEKYGSGSASARDGRGEIWTTSIHPGVVETSLAASVNESSAWMKGLLAAMRAVGMVWSADKGSWNGLFCVASEEMKAEQSEEYLEIFYRFGEPWWQSGLSKDGGLRERLEKWTGEVMMREGWIE